MSKSMIKYKENFIFRIRRFFRLLFGKKEEIQENVEKTEEHMNTTNNNFRENIEIKQDEEEIKILKLQEEYKAGNILEEDMTDKEHKKLIELYKKQNEQLKAKIDTKKYKIRKKLDDLKT